MDKLPITTRIRIIMHLPFVIPHLIVFKFSNSRSIIIDDLERWATYRKYVSNDRHIMLLCILLVLESSFRNQFYQRIGFVKHFISFLLPPVKSIVLASNIGGGFCLIHAYGTIMNAASTIGKNCTVLHGVTIGGGRGGAPILGDNVYIGAGAIIIGGVHIGNNVKIGAGAIVVDDVPDNCTVVCEKSRIIKHM
jgi:serine O-acetyltransferase